MLSRPVHRKRGETCLILGVMIMATANGHAQTLGVTNGTAAVSGQVQAPLTADAIAQGEPRRSLTIAPRISVSETLTDNAALTNTDRRSDLITAISPGLRITSDGVRVKGYFDYSLTEINYAQGSFQNTTQNALNTFGSVEAIEKWAYLDFGGTISQQAISAFGTQSVDTTAANANYTETSTYLLSPYVRGLLAGEAVYEVRYTQSGLRTKSSLVSDITTQEGLVKLAGVSTQKLIAWTVDGGNQKISYSAGRPTEADHLKATLTYAVTPTFGLIGIDGTEANNYVSQDKKSYEITGFGVKWNPSERTKLTAIHENRFFGEAHSVNFEHRTARTIWQFSDVKDVLVSPALATGGVGTVYDLYFAQFASIEPDPVRRAQLVTDFLQQNGLNPNANATNSFLPATLTIQRRQNLSFGLLGVRTAATFMLMRSETSPLDSQSTLTAALNNSSAISQNGYSLILAHRLTPESALNIFAGRQFTSGTLDLQQSSLSSLSINVSGKTGKRSSATIGIKRVIFDSATSPYVESAITGNFIVQF
jgi:uncharacterized protein (PEP-CTERM system associated)